MSRPTKLDTGIEGWMKEHSGWDCDGLKSVTRTYQFKTFGDAVAFVMKLALLAEKHDHHPDIDLRFSKVRVMWSTHDAGGLTRMDLALAEVTDTLAGV
jgi:4a-hydroxytetrahydrobiopterin dehydratase